MYDPVASLSELADQGLRRNDPESIRVNDDDAADASLTFRPSINPIEGTPRV